MNVALWVMYFAVVPMAWTLAWRRREHRPVAVLFSLGLCCELARTALDVAVLAPLRASLGVEIPWTGWAHAAGLLADALALVWPAALVGTALVVFAGRKPLEAVIGWGCAVLAFAAVHPIAGDGSETRALTAAQILSCLISAGLGVAWFRGKAKPATSAQYTLTMIVIGEVVSLLGAWRIALFETWPISQGLYLLMLGTVMLVQWRFLWSPPSSQCSV